MNYVLIAVVSLVALLAGYVIFSYRKMKNIPEVEKSEKIKDLTDKNFNHQLKGKVSLVDFWASWCMPCKMMAPVLNEIAERVGPEVQVCKVNVEQHQSLASKYAIRGIPTMLLFKNGKEINRFVGVKSREFLLDQINKAI
jgi:thioredoxin 1